MNYEEEEKYLVEDNMVYSSKNIASTGGNIFGLCFIGSQFSIKRNCENLFEYGYICKNIDRNNQR